MQRLALRDPRWLALVRDGPQPGPFHEPAWAEVVGETYGFPVSALVLDDGSAGVPVAEVGGRLRGRRLVSLPFTDACPPLAHDADALQRLTVELGRLGRVEVRAPVEGWHPVQAGLVHHLALAGDADAVRRTFHRSQVQRNIERAERLGVVVRRARDEAELTRVYYDLHVTTRRRQGVPVQPRRFFSLLWRKVLATGSGFALLAEHEGRVLGGAVFLHANGTLTYKFGASDPRGFPVRVNHALLWEAVRWGCAEGYRTFDLGRTDNWNAGLRAFKLGWGTVEGPLVYATTTTPRHRRETAAAGVVLRRAPRWVCRAAGAALYRYAA